MKSLRVAIVFALLLTACASVPGTGGTTSTGFTRNADGYADITVEQLVDMLKTKNFAFVNVHIPYEGEIAQTDLFIPFDRIAEHLAELPGKDASIVLYCRSGRMSTDAAKALVDLGYTNVYELDGGFTAWKAAGRELITKP